MQMRYDFSLLVLMNLSLMIYAKNYSAFETTRTRLRDLYRYHILTRPTTDNTSRTTVAIGLGIIEVSGIDPQKQVCCFSFP